MKLFIDIETTPAKAYVWQAGEQYINFNQIFEQQQICVIGYKYESEPTKALVWDGKTDFHLLVQLRHILNRATEIIAHNGDRFDIKFINTRLLKHNLPTINPLTFDTLKKIRQKFKHNSNKLDNLGIELNLGRKLKTDLDLWVGVLDNNEVSLNKMVKYCKKDVELLANLYYRIAPHVAPRQHAGVLRGHQKYTCPVCASYDIQYVNTIATPKGSLQHQMKCKCNHNYIISDRTYKNFKLGL